MADLPFLKNKNKKKLGTVIVAHSQDSTDLMPHITSELIEAIHRKDIKAIREALRALVLMIQDEDREQDSLDQEN